MLEVMGSEQTLKNMDPPNVDIIAVNFFIALVFGVLYTV